MTGRHRVGNPIACKLVEDEPAHDLDIQTLERLAAWPVDDLGTVLLVSHARAA